jgi:hypothetical protein
MAISAVRTVLASVLASVLATASLGALAGPAAAADCGSSRIRYGVTEYWTYWEYADEESVDGPGGAVTATLKKAQTKTTSIGGKAGAEAKDVFKGISASAELHGSVTWSTTIEKGRSFSHTITPDKYGHLRYRFQMYDVRWVKYIHYERCADEWAEQGSATVVSKTDGWRYWETDNGTGPPPDDGRTHTGPFSSGPPNPPVDT